MCVHPVDEAMDGPGGRGEGSGEGGERGEWRRVRVGGERGEE